MRELLHEVNQPLIDAAAAMRDFDAAAVRSLRRQWPAELVKAAVDLTVARRKAAAKFRRADQMWIDPAGVEQATSEDIAAHKAARFAMYGRDVIDLCCGIGGDALGIAPRLQVTVADASEERVRMARHNVGVYGHTCEAVVADVTTLKLAGRSYHIDPARRTAGRRLHRYADYQPGPAFLTWLVERGGAGAIKLGPGIDPAELPPDSQPAELEFISRRGTLVQAVLWTKQLARAERSATIVDTAGAHTISGTPMPLPIAPPHRYLLEVDAGVERARLMGNLAVEHDAAAIHPALGLLTADRAIPSPFVTAFELIEQMPWRPHKVKQWLEAHDAGIIEVKTRGKAVNPDVVAAQLRGGGSITFTVFILRMGQRVIAWVTRRVGSDLPSTADL